MTLYFTPHGVSSCFKAFDTATNDSQGESPFPKYQGSWLLSAGSKSAHRWFMYTAHHSTQKSSHSSIMSPCQAYTCIQMLPWVLTSNKPTKVKDTTALDDSLVDSYDSDSTVSIQGNKDPMSVDQPAHTVKDLLSTTEGVLIPPSPFDPFMLNFAPEKPYLLLSNDFWACNVAKLH